MSAVEVNHQSSELAAPRHAAIAAKKAPLYKRLYVQVLAAVVLGTMLGYAYPDLSAHLKPYSDAFIRAIKVVIAPIIFTTIAVGIARVGDIRRVANVGVKALIYFEIASTLALVVGMVVGNLWRVGAGLSLPFGTS